MSAPQHATDTGASALQQPLAVDRLLELLAVFIIATGLIGLATALTGVFHAPQVLLTALLLLSGYAWWTRASQFNVRTPPKGTHLLLILLVGLFFRVPPYLYLLGGQDEGLYVDMAVNLARTGTIVPRDAVLDSLQDPAARVQYVQDNYEPLTYLMGVYRFSGNPPRLEFQFYHLFPVWMAMFVGLFGLGASVYALTFLALVSLLFFYRLTLALTESRSAALVAGLLLAVNPLHAFFSKFPVSEVPTLAFSLMGFTFVAIYWRAEGTARQRRWLVLGALAFLCLFTTRISGFLYLPFLLLLSAATLLCDPDPARRSGIHRWVVAVVGLYAASVIYGLTWSGFYSRDIYHHSFEEVFQEHWRAGILICVSVGLAGWLAVWLGSRVGRVRGVLSRGVRWAHRLLGPALLLIVLLGAYKAYQLGFTTRYVADPSLGVRFQLAATGWRALTASSLVVSAVYLCPPLFIAFLLLLLRCWHEPGVVAAVLFLTYFVVQVALLEWVVPYQPYYARYLLSELVPYAILFVICASASLQPGRLRTALSTLLLFSGLYGVALSAAQIGKQENEGVYESVSRLAAHVGPRDLLLIDDAHIRGFNISELKTPLVYAFGLQVADISAASLEDEAYLTALARSYEDLFLVSGRATPPPRFALVDSLRFWVMAFDHLSQPPTRTVARIDSHLYLFRLDRTKFAAGTIVDFGSGGMGNDWLETGWSHLEPWGIWGIGYSAKLRINPQALTVNAPISGLKFQLKAFVSPQHREQHVRVLLDGAEVQQLHFRYPDATDLPAEVPLSPARLQGSRPITVEFVMPEAVSPQSVGLSGDPRVIGVGLKSVELLSARER